MPFNEFKSWGRVFIIGYYFHWLNRNAGRWVTGRFKMPIKKIVKSFRLFHSTIVLNKSNFKSTTSLSNILHSTVIQNIYLVRRFSVQICSVSNWELSSVKRWSNGRKYINAYNICTSWYCTSNAYIPRLLNRLIYLRKMCDFKGDLLI